MVKWPCVSAETETPPDVEENKGKPKDLSKSRQQGTFITRASEVPTRLTKYSNTAPRWEEHKNAKAVHDPKVLIARGRHHSSNIEDEGQEVTENQNTIVAPGLPEVATVQRLITFGHQRESNAEEAINLHGRKITVRPDDMPLLQTVPNETSKYLAPAIADMDKNVEERDAREGSFRSQQNLRRSLFRDNALGSSSSSGSYTSSSEEVVPPPLPPPPPPAPTPKPTPIPSPPKPASPEEPPQQESSSSEEEPEIELPPSPPPVVPSPPVESSSSEEEEVMEPPPPPPPPKPKVEPPRPVPPPPTTTCPKFGTHLFDLNKINENLWETRKLLFGDYINVLEPCPPPPEPNCGCGSENCDCCCCTCNDCCTVKDENNIVTTKVEKKPVSPPKKPLIPSPPPLRPPPQAPVIVQKVQTKQNKAPITTSNKKPKQAKALPRSRSKKRKGKSRSKSKKKRKPRSRSRGGCGGRTPGGGCGGPPRMPCGCCMFEESSSSSSSESEDDGIRPGASFPTEFLWFMLTMNSTSQYYKLNSSYQANYCAALAREKYEAAQKPYVNTVDVGCLEEIVWQEGEEVLRNKELAITLRHFPKDANSLPQNPLIDLNSMKLFTSGRKRKCCGKGKGKCGDKNKSKEKDNKDGKYDSDECESDDEEDKACPPSYCDPSPHSQYLVNCPPMPPPIQMPQPMQPVYSPPPPCYPTYSCYTAYPTCAYPSYPPCPYPPPGTYCYPPPFPPPPWQNSNDFSRASGGERSYNEDRYDRYDNNEYDEYEEEDYYEGEGDDSYYGGENGGNMRNSREDDDDTRGRNYDNNAPYNENMVGLVVPNFNGNGQPGGRRTVSFNQAARARGSNDSSYRLTLDSMGNFKRSTKNER